MSADADAFKVAVWCPAALDPLPRQLIWEYCCQWLAVLKIRCS